MPSSQKTILIVLSILISSGVTPIIIRITQDQGMPSLVIVFIRLWIVSLGLTPIVWIRYRQQLLSLSKKQILFGIFAGFWLAVNLLMFFWGLEFTSVLITSVLRRTTPLWIITPEILLLGAVFTRRIWLSLGLSIIGVILITLGAGGIIETGAQPLLGAGAAIASAISFGIYLLIGRKLNNAMPTILYSWLAFLSAAIIITVFILVSQTPVLGYSASGYLWTLAVTFLAQIMGQMVINLGLQRFSATAMAIILQVSVVLSVIIAVLLFSEIPTIWQIIGSVMVIIGVILATIEQSNRKVIRT
ncbi:MAG: DMT family transporter [Phototrophicaceae bacterium]